MNDKEFGAMIITMKKIKFNLPTLPEPKPRVNKRNKRGICPTLVRQPLQYSLSPLIYYLLPMSHSLQCFKSHTLKQQLDSIFPI